MKPISPRYPTFVIYEGYDRALALESVGPGWSSLINEVFDFIEQNKIPQKVVQVKEKWGGLRIYTDVIDNRLDAKIREMEKKSFNVCEDCGEPGKLRSGGWYRTLCDAHGKDKPIVKDED
jgi:hypothetical protein